MSANYNNSAWFYDKLSALVYGKALVNAQVYLLDYITPRCRILIVGGGTGWILDEITRRQPAGLSITYIEISAKMMIRSKKRNIGANEVIFINSPVEEVNLPTDFDVVMSPFLFDNFNEATMHKVFTVMHHSLKKGGLWLNTDFRLTGKWWQWLLLKSMLLFFKLLCGIESTRLPDIEQCFRKYHYQLLAEKPFYGHFILSEIHQKV